jgi:hypothetical protein
VRVLFVLAMTLLLGCSPNVRDGMGPRVPIPGITGTVTRGGAPAGSIHVELRDATGSTKVASASTDASGLYGFPPEGGSWQVRANGGVGADFASVERVFSSVDGHAVVSALDLSSAGMAMLAPADGASMPPAPDSVAFRWRPPTRSVLSARVQLYDSAGAAVWYSGSTSDSVAWWSGRANQGAFSGSAAPRGRYTWRIRFAFPDSSEARTGKRELLLP